MVKNNTEKEDVIVAFNGKDHKLRDWKKKSRAQADDDPSLNWKKVFEEHTPRPNVGESAPTGFVPYKSVKKKKKKGNVSAPSIGLLLKQFWVPFLSAIIVGLGIGFTVLIMFSHHNTANKRAVETTATVDQQNVTNGVTKSFDGKPFLINLQVIQGGTFNTRQGAKDRLDELKSNGVPAAIFVENGKYDVMIGVAEQETIRRELGKSFTGVELYGKSWKYQPQSIKTSKPIETFLETGKDLFQAMIPVSTENAIHQKVDSQSLKNINGKLSQWASIDQLNVKGSLKSDLTSFRGAVEAAYSHIANTDDKDNGQQSLLDAISIYQKILIALSE